MLVSADFQTGSGANTSTAADEVALTSSDYSQDILGRMLGLKQTGARMSLPSSSIVRILKSMPMVVMNEGVKESSLKRSRQHDLPTPESPMRSSLICEKGFSGLFGMYA